MSLFDRIGGSSDDDGDEQADGNGERDAEDGSVEETGPNFMPEKQRSLYVTAYENKVHLSDRGTCGTCGTTLRPVQAGTLLASCKNEDCENHLTETELGGAERFYDRNGHPEDLEIDAERSEATDGDGNRSALGGFDAVTDDE